MDVDLRREQQDSLQRSPYDYSRLSRLFFAAMDLVAGRETSLAKARLLEVLAGVPYRAWERREEACLPRRDAEQARAARGFIGWTRAARANEDRHLEVLDERARAVGVADPWYLRSPARLGAVACYVAFAGLLARGDMRRAVLFNAEFEDHAEHEYARWAADHPEWDEEPPGGEAAGRYGAETGATLASWADVIRRIALDERHHRDRSFIAAGRPDLAVGRQEGRK
jgi:hypothetical protein